MVIRQDLLKCFDYQISRHRKSRGMWTHENLLQICVEKNLVTVLLIIVSFLKHIVHFNPNSFHCYGIWEFCVNIYFSKQSFDCGLVLPCFVFETASFFDTFSLSKFFRNLPFGRYTIELYLNKIMNYNSFSLSV